MLIALVAGFMSVHSKVNTEQSKLTAARLELAQLSLIKKPAVVQKPIVQKPIIQPPAVVSCPAFMLRQAACSRSAM